jgi:hypothetical protein
MNRAKVRRVMVGTPVRTQAGWEIPSLVTGEIYTIERDFWGHWVCTCPSPEQPCKHGRKVLAMLEAEQEVSMG